MDITCHSWCRFPPDPMKIKRKSVRKSSYSMKRRKRLSILQCCNNTNHFEEFRTCQGKHISGKENSCKFVTKHFNLLNFDEHQKNNLESNYSQNSVNFENTPTLETKIQKNISYISKNQNKNQNEIAQCQVNTTNGIKINFDRPSSPNSHLSLSKPRIERAAEAYELSSSISGTTTVNTEYNINFQNLNNQIDNHEHNNNHNYHLSSSSSHNKASYSEPQKNPSNSPLHNSKNNNDSVTNNSPTASATLTNDNYININDNHRYCHDYVHHVPYVNHFSNVPPSSSYLNYFVPVHVVNNHHSHPAAAAPPVYQYPQYQYQYQCMYAPNITYATWQNVHYYNDQQQVMYTLPGVYYMLYTVPAVPSPQQSPPPPASELATPSPATQATPAPSAPPQSSNFFNTTSYMGSHHHHLHLHHHQLHRNENSNPVSGFHHDRHDHHHHHHHDQHLTENVNEQEESVSSPRLDLEQNHDHFNDHDLVVKHSVSLRPSNSYQYPTPRPHLQSNEPSKYSQCGYIDEDPMSIHIDNTIDTITKAEDLSVVSEEALELEEIYKNPCFDTISMSSISLINTEAESGV